MMSKQRNNCLFVSMIPHILKKCQKNNLKCSLFFFNFFIEIFNLNFKIKSTHQSLKMKYCKCCKTKIYFYVKKRIIIAMKSCNCMKQCLLRINFKNCLKIQFNYRIQLKFCLSMDIASNTNKLHRIQKIFLKFKQLKFKMKLYMKSNRFLKNGHFMTTRCN